MESSLSKKKLTNFIKNIVEVLYELLPVAQCHVKYLEKKVKKDISLNFSVSKW